MVIWLTETCNAGVRYVYKLVSKYLCAFICTVIYMCVYIYIHTHTLTYIHTHTHTYIHTHTHTYTYDRNVSTLDFVQCPVLKKYLSTPFCAKHV
jgi:hypothetical protein